MTSMANKTVLAPSERVFEDDTREVLRGLRVTLAAVISGLPDEPRKAADLQRQLGLDKTLSWQVFRFATAPDPLQAASNLPGVAALRQFTQAAARRGVSKQAIEAARQAISGFDRVIAEHAGDRRMFDALLSGLPGVEADQIDLATRRQAFRCTSRICGVQAKTHLTTQIFQPNDTDPTALDFTGIRVMHDLRRIRHDSACIIASFVAREADGSVHHEVNRRPIDPTGQTSESIDLMPTFCSEPVPQLRQFTDASGVSHVEVTGNNVGNKAAVTTAMGSLFPASLARYCDEHNPIHDCNTEVRIPCEALVLDMLVREDTFESLDPVARVYTDHRGLSGVTLERECDLLPMDVSVERLGRGTMVLHTPDAPRYVEMMQDVFDRLGWDSERFDVYRCRVEYPVMPSSVTMQFDLPEKPEGTNGAE